MLLAFRFLLMFFFPRKRVESCFVLSLEITLTVYSGVSNYKPPLGKTIKVGLISTNGLIL